MTWAPKGPFGSIVEEESTITCDDCKYSIRTADLTLADDWLDNHDCEDPEGWEPSYLEDTDG